MQFVILERLLWPIFCEIVLLLFFFTCLNKIGFSGDWITPLYLAINGSLFSSKNLFQWASEFWLRGCWIFHYLPILPFGHSEICTSKFPNIYTNPTLWEPLIVPVITVSWISNKLNTVCSKVCRREPYHLWEIKNCTTEYHGSSWMTSVTQMESNRPTALPRWGRISHAHTRSPPQRIPQVICCFVTFSFL